MAFNFEGFEYKPVGKTPAQQNEANREHYGQQPGVYTTGSLNHDAFNESDHPRAANGQFGSGGGVTGAPAKSSKFVKSVRSEGGNGPITHHNLYERGENGKPRKVGTAKSDEEVKQFLSAEKAKAHEISEKTARVNPSVEARVTAAREARQAQRKKDLAEEAEGKKRDYERTQRLKAAATNDTDIELLRQELNEFLTEEKQELEHKDFNLIAAQ